MDQYQHNFRTPNDRFVTKAWGESLGASGKVDFFPDWDGSFVKFLGLDGS
jgi:peroxiredoxin